MSHSAEACGTQNMMSTDFMSPKISNAKKIDLFLGFECSASTILSDESSERTSTTACAGTTCASPVTLCKRRLFNTSEVEYHRGSTKCHKSGIKDRTNETKRSDKDDDVSYLVNCLSSQPS